jgi:hypothetical protein
MLLQNLTPQKRFQKFVQQRGIAAEVELDDVVVDLVAEVEFVVAVVLYNVVAKVVVTVVAGVLDNVLRGDIVAVAQAAIAVGKRSSESGLGSRNSG